MAKLLFVGPACLGSNPSGSVNVTPRDVSSLHNCNSSKPTQSLILSMADFPELFFSELGPCTWNIPALIGPRDILIK